MSTIRSPCARLNSSAMNATEEAGATPPPENANQAPNTRRSGVTNSGVLKAKDHPGAKRTVVFVTSAAGNYGPQWKLTTSQHEHVYVSQQSAVGKGISSGAIKPPFEISSETAIGPKGKSQIWVLGRRA